jgi:hypothetical protein
MGSVLDYCHVPGLLGNIDELRVAADNESAAYSEFYDRWWTVHGRTSVRVAEVLDLFKQDESLAGMVGDRGELSQANRLGRVLNSLVDVVHGGKRIVRVTGRGNANRFRCELLPLNTDLYGENGGPIINDPKYNGTANHVIKPVEVGDGLLPTLDTRLLGSGPQTASDGNSQMADGAGGAGKAPFWVDLD